LDRESTFRRTLLMGQELNLEQKRAFLELQEAFEMARQLSPSTTDFAELMVRMDNGDSFVEMLPQIRESTEARWRLAVALDQIAEMGVHPIRYLPPLRFMYQFLDDVFAATKLSGQGSTNERYPPSWVDALEMYEYPRVDEVSKRLEAQQQ
jgi:hypothetical protein